MRASCLPRSPHLKPNWANGLEKAPTFILSAIINIIPDVIHHHGKQSGLAAPLTPLLSTNSPLLSIDSKLSHSLVFSQTCLIYLNDRGNEEYFLKEAQFPQTADSWDRGLFFQVWKHKMGLYVCETKINKKTPLQNMLILTYTEKYIVI